MDEREGARFISSLVMWCVMGQASWVLSCTYEQVFKVSERSERALRKTRILGDESRGFWLQTKRLQELTYSNIFARSRTRFSLKMRLATLGAVPSKNHTQLCERVWVGRRLVGYNLKVQQQVRHDARPPIHAKLGGGAELRLQNSNRN